MLGARSTQPEVCVRLPTARVLTLAVLAVAVAQQPLTTDQHGSQPMRNAPEYPNAALLAKRDTLRDVALPVIDGALPPGLAGHLFVMSTVGTVDSNGAPYPDKNDRPTVINGDGMVWRFDLSEAGVKVSCDIVKPPCYHYDEMTRTGEPLAFAGFGDLGMLRASLFLGTRNFANTAFVPMPPAKPGDAPRLICCYDAGPPVEIDPATLETLGVVGESWDAEALDGLVAFPPVLSTAHPMYDPETKLFFCVNYGRSSLSMLESVPFFEALAFLPEAMQNVLGRAAAIIGKAPLVPKLLSLPSKLASWALQATQGMYQRREDTFIPKNFLDLVVWRGEGDIVRLPVVDMATGKPAVVEQSMHQIAVTRHYVLLLDTNFKLRFEQFYNNPFPHVPELERLIRTMLATQQGTTSNVWVIRKDAVVSAFKSSTNHAVPGFKVPLLGAVHFLADYDDSAGIRIQCAHGNALDIAEWVRRDDQRLSGDMVREQMHGMVAGTVDVSELGQYLIDPIQRRVVDGRTLSGDALWGIALYAGRGVPAWDAVPERLRYCFWFATGLWDDTYTLFIRGLYADYRDRKIPLGDIDRLVSRGGMPSTLVTVDLEAFRICDCYTFERGVSLSSPQFVPDPARSGDRGGWVTCVVWTTDSSMVWVFDAENLAQGPVAKLLVPVTLGFSLHTAWMPTVAADEAAEPAAPRMKADHHAALERRMRHLKPKAKKRIDDVLAGRSPRR